MLGAAFDNIMDTAIQQITTLLQLLVSALDNHTRQDAERNLKQKWIVANPHLGIPTLAHIARTHVDHPIRSFSAVLLRRLALCPVTDVAQDGTKCLSVPLLKLNAESRTATLTEILGALASESNPSARRKISDTVAELAKTMITRDQQWPELMPAVFQCIQSPDQAYRESAFNILSAIPQLLIPQGVVDVASIMSLFERPLSDTEVVPVRVAALDAAVQFLIDVNQNAQSSFQALMVQMLNVLPYLLTNDHEEELAKAIQSLIDLANSVPKLFRPILPQLVDFIVSLMTYPNLDPPTKHTALELLLTLVEEAPSMVRKVAPTFAQKVVPLCLEMMATITDDMEWHTTNDIDDLDDNNESYVVAEQAMDRLARRLGASAMTPISFDLIRNMLQSEHWNQRHAALMAISAIGEGCFKVMLKELGKIVDMVVPFTRDPNPRVRFATCNCIGQLATDFSPTIQKRFYAKIIPALITCMDDISNPRVHAHGAAAMVNFCEDVERSSLQEYLDPLFKRLVALSSSPKIYVQEQAITTMATIADAAESAFAPYYSSVMPALLNILNVPNQKELQTLRGKAMECASLIAMAVQRDMFKPDAPAFIQALQRIQSQVNDPEDPQHSYLMHAWARICTVIEADFVPYLATVMPPLLETAQLKPELALLDSQEDQQQYSADDGWQHLEIQGQRLCIRTSLLDEKESAIEMLSCYARNLKLGFRDYAVQALRVLVANLDFFYHDGVRQVSVGAMAVTIATAPDLPEIRQLWGEALGKLFQQLPEESDPEYTNQALMAISECILILQRSALTESHASELVNVLSAVFADYRNRISRREAARLDEDFDPEAEEAIEEEAELENTVLTGIAHVVQALLKVYGAEILPLLHAPVLMHAFECMSERDEDLQIYGFAIFDDVLEYASQAVAQYIPVVSDKFLKGLNAKNPNIRQSVVFGIGLAARTRMAEFAPMIFASLTPIAAIIQHPNAHDDDEILATENAIAALAHILQSGLVDAQMPPGQRDEVLGFWIRNMPIVCDDEEAPAATKFLISLIDTLHPVLMANVTFAVSALMELLYQGVHEGDVNDAGTDLVSVLVDRARRLLTGLSESQRESQWSTMSEDKRLAMKQIFG